MLAYAIAEGEYSGEGCEGFRKLHGHHYPLQTSLIIFSLDQLEFGSQASQAARAVRCLAA